MTRDELVEAGAQAVADTGEVLEGDFYGVRDLVGVILDAVEPLIRADERWRRTVNNPLLLADLRAKVKALPIAHPDDPEYNCLFADDVMALFDGENRDA